MTEGTQGTEGTVSKMKVARLGDLDNIFSSPRPGLNRLR